MTQEGDFSPVSGPIDQSRSRVFSIMWAVAHVLHLGLHGEGALSFGTEAVVFLSGIIVLLRPRSTRALQLMAATQLVDWVSVAPFNPDHWTLVAAVNLTLLLAGITHRERDGHVVEKAAGSLRILLLIAYGAAAFAKWNWAFLSPVTSCAVWIADQASFGLFEGLPGAGPVAIGFAIGSETVVFLLLLMRRTRRFGVRLGLLFHTVVSLSPAMAVSDFTATVFALFVLFLSEAEIDAAVRRLADLTHGSPTVAIFRQRRWIVPAWLAFCGGVAGYSSQSLSLLIVWLTFTTYAAVVLIAVLPVAELTEPLARLRPTWAMIPAAAFLAFTVLNPYLGLRTTGAFTMFSNLRTEGGGSNHLIVGGWHLASFQNELFTIVDSNDASLRALAEDRQALPLASVRSLPRLAPGLTMTGTIDDVAVTWTEQTSELVIGDPSWFERWLLSFRPVSLDGVPRCGN